ncbi:filamentation induced by cAMP protein Fic [Fibrisoma limi BUZ 3]|uniref:Filamentation induced by cAMP protein Fic n=1 Tax=Fibrisoma limi BUZ 3 TaxID=1185876 RepID=I2GK12_9BACT|nr:filamentation induced by cAMP protein Fic [Fibrisoma limi BUZ 3]
MYRPYSDQHSELTSEPTKEVLRYREALWTGFHFLQQHGRFSLDYFAQIFQEIKQTTEVIRPAFSQVYIRQGGSGPNAGKPIYTPLEERVFWRLNRPTCVPFSRMISGTQLISC